MELHELQTVLELLELQTVTVFPFRLIYPNELFSILTGQSKTQCGRPSGRAELLLLLHLLHLVKSCHMRSCSILM